MQRNLCLAINADALTWDWRGQRDDPAVGPQRSRSGRKTKLLLVCVSLRNPQFEITFGKISFVG